MKPWAWKFNIPRLLKYALSLTTFHGNVSLFAISHRKFAADADKLGKIYWRDLFGCEMPDSNRNSSGNIVFSAFLLSISFRGISSPNWTCQRHSIKNWSKRSFDTGSSFYFRRVHQGFRWTKSSGLPGDLGNDVKNVFGWRQSSSSNSQIKVRDVYFKKSVTKK